MSKKLNIYLAGPRGFCAGVDRAIEMVKGALKNMVSLFMSDMKLFTINL